MKAAILWANCAIVLVSELVDFTDAPYGTERKMQETSIK